MQDWGNLPGLPRGWLGWRGSYYGGTTLSTPVQAQKGPLICSTTVFTTEESEGQRGKSGTQRRKYNHRWTQMDTDGKGGRETYGFFLEVRPLGAPIRRGTNSRRAQRAQLQAGRGVERPEKKLRISRLPARGGDFTDGKPIWKSGKEQPELPNSHRGATPWILKFFSAPSRPLYYNPSKPCFSNAFLLQSFL